MRTARRIFARSIVSGADSIYLKKISDKKRFCREKHLTILETVFCHLSTIFWISPQAKGMCAQRLETQLFARMGRLQLNTG